MRIDLDLDRTFTTIDEAFEKSVDDILSKKIRKVSEKIYEDLFEDIKYYFSDNIKYWVDNELHYWIEKIFEALLLEDEKMLDEFGFKGRFSLNRIHQIRMKIWETCSKEIENSIIEQLKERIETLEFQISCRDSYR